MKPKIYIETTIVGYLTSRSSRNVIIAGNQAATKDWWKDASSHFDMFVSQFVVDEVAEGDTVAAKKRLASIRNIPMLAIGIDSLDLAQELVARAAIPRRAEKDASHLAVATIHGMEYLVTWNCRHLANAVLRRKIERVCENAGYRAPVICTPLELTAED